MKKLTKAEEEIMHIIWEIGPCTVGDIRNYIAEEQGRKKPPHSTISTMVRILDEKGFLTHKAYGRTFVYSANLTKEQYSKQSLRELARDYFGGSMNRLVSFLVKEDDLSLEELSELLEKLEDEED
jgi:BlaI family penicillinase repressor